MAKKGITISDKDRRAIASFVLTSYVISTIINIICIASIATFFVYNHQANAEKVLVPFEVLEVIE
jgi:hypothetical protein